MALSRPMFGRAGSTAVVFIARLPASYDTDRCPRRDCFMGRRSIRRGGTAFPLIPWVQDKLQDRG